MYFGIGEMRRRLAAKRPRCGLRYRLYEQKAGARAFDMLVPEDMKWVTPVIGWCTQAVDFEANKLIFDEFGNDVFAFGEIFDMNSRDVFIKDAILSALITACSFVYISAGADGYPRLQVIDGMNATGVIEPTTKLLTEGYAVLSRREYFGTDGTAAGGGQPKTEAYFTAEETVIYEDGRISAKIPNPAPYPLLVPVINRPDAKRPFGHSRISRACIEYQAEAFRTLKLSEVSSAFYSVPQKWVTGMDGEAEFNGKRATVASFVRFDRDPESGDKPTAGQFTAQSMNPFNDRLRMIASLFAGETAMTLDDLGFSTDNPATAEAINAAHDKFYDLCRAAQSDFGIGLKNTGYIAACLRDNYGYERQVFRDIKPIWYPVERKTASIIGATGDAIYKINEASPGYIGDRNMMQLTGLKSDAERSGSQ